ncbi:MAG: carboxypeptidase-like regulatory domain-containing protein [Planctomycetota bacterium]
MLGKWQGRLFSTLLPVIVFLPACGGGDGRRAVLPQVVSGQTDQRTLSGTILQTDGTGLEGVTVTVGAAATATTDGDGNFIIQDPDAGTVEVKLDGTTAPVPGASFPTLRLTVDVAADGATTLPQAVTLVDLNDPATAQDTVPVDVTGTTTQPLAAAGPGGDLRLDAPAGTVVLIDGAPAAGSVDIRATPVAAADVPMPLAPPGPPLDASSYATIQPAHASFDTGGGLGLDVQLPNLRDFPVGTTVDIWSFDHDVGDWVNRSAQTGNQGVVVDLGGGLTTIDAGGVITEGGWHGGVLPVDGACATTIVGRVVDQNLDPVPGAYIAVSTGQFGTTAADGTFSIPSVPAYVVADLPGCTPVGVTVEVLTPVAYGAVPAAVNVAAGTIVSGGTTDLGDIAVAVPDTGGLVGLVTDNGTGVVGATVDISGPATTTPTTGANGMFFSTGLVPGDYTASFRFAGEPAPTQVTFTVASNEITTINLQRSTGTGGGSVTVLVILEEDDDFGTPGVPAAGAKVLLFGTDAGSAGGILGVANSEGRVTFHDVDGPFTVTAQLDVLVPSTPPGVGRVATSVIDVQPPAGTLGMLLFGFRRSGPPTLDATLAGTVSNRPALGPNEDLVVEARNRGEHDNFLGQVQVDPTTGAYTLAIPSGEVFDAVLVHRGSNGAPISAMLVFGVGPASPAGTVTRNFDFGSSAVIPFDRTVTMTYNNALAAPLNGSVHLGVQDPSIALRADLFLNLGGGAQPATVKIPDVADPNLAGLWVTLSPDQEGQDAAGNDIRVDCDSRLATTPTAFTVTFEDVPTVNSPPSNALLTVAQAEALAVDFDPVTGGLAQGLNLVEIDSVGGTGLAVDETLWTIVLPKGTTSFTLPPTARPMFGPKGSYELLAEAFRFAGPPFDFNVFGDENIEQNVRSILVSVAECNSEYRIFFDTQ